MDAYGAFSDPAPSGFGAGAAERPTSFSEASGLGGAAAPGVSRTMQYADPYAAVRATIASSTPSYASGPVPGPGSTSPVHQPAPPYSEYTGYR